MCLARALTPAALLVLPGCETAYYSTLEQFGIEKRDVLVDRVADARDAQHEAKEQFESALEQFVAATGYDGGELQERYRSLKDAFESSEDRARAVRERIAKVEDGMRSSPSIRVTACARRAAFSSRRPARATGSSSPR
jgi:hypothetical protein